MLEAFKAITTSITAIFSIWIAYQSHKTTIAHKNLEKEERSEKVMRLFHRETLNLRAGIYILTVGSTEYQENFKSEEPIDIHGTIEKNDIVSYIKNYKNKTEEIISDRLNELILEDEKRLSKSISLSEELLIKIDLLKSAVKTGNRKKEIQKYQDQIAETTEELVNKI